MRPAYRMTALAFLGALLAIAGNEPGRASAAPAAPVVSVGATSVTGIFINSLGHIAAPAVAGPEAEWTVEYEGERYPARVIAAPPRYGVVFLKIDRQKPFPFVKLSERLASVSAKLKLVGQGAGGASVERDAGIRGLRRKIPELSLDGSYYELSVAGESPRDGTPLLDPATGEVFGLLVAEKGAAGERYALLSSSISDRAANADIALGDTSPPRVRAIVWGDGHTSPANPSLLAFSAAGRNQRSASRVRAAQDWRSNSGFWINSLTSPVIEGSAAYFGSTQGLLYAVDLATMQRQWYFPNEDPVFFPPSVGDTAICCGSGDLSLKADEQDDPVLTALYGQRITRKHKVMVDHGYINCVDRKTGVYKWLYETRFVTQPRIVRDRVVFGGMGTLGVLDLATGKKVWALDLDRTDLSPTFYSIGGADAERMWVLAVTVKLSGSGTPKDRFRLEQEGRPAAIECYRLDGDRKPLWSTPLRTPRDAPGLSGSLLLSQDGKTCFGAAAKDMFAVDAASGQLLWQKPVFSENFGGNLTYGDGMVFATDSGNKMFALNAADGAPVWSFEGKKPLCLPLAQDGMVYIGSLDTWIYALDARTGKLIWKFETDGGVCGQPRVVGNKLYCMSDDGRLTVLELPQ